MDNIKQQTDLNQNGRKHGEEMKSVLFDKFISVTYRLAMLCKDNNGKAVIPGKLVDDAKELIGELEKELNIVQDSERAEAQEADRLRAKVKELGKKLTETIKLLGERSRECGELEAHNEVLQRRVQEFSMELLDRTMKENKDVLQRLKKGEE